MTSSTETLKTAAEPLRTIAAIAGVAFVGIKNLASAVRHRRDVEVLARFDDRMLADIGLTRSDLSYALSEPFWRDPGRVLVSRAGDRRTEWRPRGGERPDRIVPAPSIAPETATRALVRC
jgi:uncharacterized protein YjiS (DUF1127 family)